MKKILMLIVVSVVSLFNMPLSIQAATSPDCICTINGRPNQTPPSGVTFKNNDCTQPQVLNPITNQMSAPIGYSCQTQTPPPPATPPAAPTCSTTVITPPATATAGLSYVCLPASGVTNPTSLVQISYTAPGTTTSTSAYVPLEYFTGTYNAVTGITTQNGQIFITYDDTKFAKDTNPADDVSNLSYRFHNAVNAAGCSCTAYRLLSPYNSAIKLGAVINCNCGPSATNVIIPTLKWTSTNPKTVQAINGQLVATYS